MISGWQVMVWLNLANMAMDSSEQGSVMFGSGPSKSSAREGGGTFHAFLFPNAGTPVTHSLFELTYRLAHFGSSSHSRLLYEEVGSDFTK